MSPTARLTPGFLANAEKTGLTDSALAAAIGVSKQFYSQVKNGQAAPSVAFMAGAVRAGLARTFADVAEAIPEAEQAA